MSAVRAPVGLYGITPEWDDTDRLLLAVAHAAQAGLRTLQLRRKEASPEKLIEQGRALRQACTAAGVVFIVNDDWRLALDLGADGAHLGRDDGALIAARQAAPAGFLLGASCYGDLQRVRDALAAGADSVALGAVFASPTKPLAPRVPLSVVTQARALCVAATRADGTRPGVTAIGGITPDNAASVAAAGADAIAVISALFAAPDLVAAARQFAAAAATPFTPGTQAS